MPPSPAQRAEIADRREQLMRLRQAGLSYGQIARQVKKADGSPAYRSPAAAAGDFTRALADGRALLGGEATNVVVLELARLDGYIQNAEWALSRARSKGDAELVLKALDRLGRLHDRRANMLGLSRGMGAPAPDHPADDLRERRERRRRAAGG